MVKGEYVVKDVEASKTPKQGDGSFKSCIVTMIIIFLILVIIVLSIWRFGPRSINGRYHGGEDSWKENEKYKQDHGYAQDTTHDPDTTTRTAIKKTTPQKFQKIVVLPTTTSTTTTSPTSTTSTTSTTTTEQQLPNTESLVFIYVKTATTEPTTTFSTPYLSDYNYTDDAVKQTTTTTSSTNIRTTHVDHANSPTDFVGTNIEFEDSTTFSYLQETTLQEKSTSFRTKEKLIELIVGTTVDITESTTDDSGSMMTELSTVTMENSTEIEATSPESIASITVHTTLADDSTESSTTEVNIFTTDLTDIDTTETVSAFPEETLTPIVFTEETTENILDTSPEIESTSTKDDEAKSTFYSSTTEFRESTQSTYSKVESTTTHVPTPITEPTTTVMSLLDVNGTCMTSECKILASRMLSMMNHSVDPCDNFYEFACGGLRNNRALLQEDPEDDVWNRIAGAVKQITGKSNPIYQRFRSFYDQCVDYDNVINASVRIEKAKKVINEVSTMYNDLQWQTADKSFSLTDLLTKLLRLNSALLFDVQLDVNSHDPTKFQLKLTLPRIQTKLQLENPTAARCKSQIFADDPHNIDLKHIYQSKYLPCTRNLSAYLDTAEKAVKELELYGNIDPYNVTQSIGHIRFFIEFSLFSHLESFVGWEMRNELQSKTFVVKTVEDLNNDYPEVQWHLLFSSLLNTEIDPSVEVQVYFEDYFDKLFGELRTHLSNASARLIVHNGLITMLAHDLYVDLIQPNPCNREEYCLKIASGLMEDVSSSIYLSTFKAEELNEKQHEVETLFEQLKNSLEEQLREASWLDDESRSAVINKLQKMTVKADGGRALYNDSYYLSNQLNSNDLKTTNTYFENAIQLTKRYRNMMYYLYELTPDSSENIWSFFLLPYDTSALAVYQLNTVIIPYGMIGAWKSTFNLPGYVFKTRIGTAIARQIAHHFDTTGIKYDADKLTPDLLSEYSKDSYDGAYENCEVIFAGFDKSWTNQNNQNYIFKGEAKRTMDEHISDNSALWFTYKLFNETASSEPLLPWLGMNHDKLYVLLAAQEFCTKAELLDYTVLMFESEQSPPSLRVDNMIQHSQEFGLVYSCPHGGSQNPVVKCSSFPEMDEDYNGVKVLPTV